MTKDTRFVTIRVPADAMPALEAAAQESMLSLSAYIRFVVFEHIRKNQRDVAKPAKPEKTKASEFEALKPDVQAYLIAHHEMVARHNRSLKMGYTNAEIAEAARRAAKLSPEELDKLRAETQVKPAP